MSVSAGGGTPDVPPDLASSCSQASQVQSPSQITSHLDGKLILYPPRIVYIPPVALVDPTLKLSPSTKLVLPNLAHDVGAVQTFDRESEQTITSVFGRVNFVAAWTKAKANERRSSLRVRAIVVRYLRENPENGAVVVGLLLGKSEPNNAPRQRRGRMTDL